MAMAGDELAKQVISDKGNPAKTKIAIKSITKMYKFAENLIDQKDKAESKQQAKEQEKINQAASKIIDPPYTETSEFKEQVHRPKKDPFDEAMKKVHEK